MTPRTQGKLGNLSREVNSPQNNTKLEHLQLGI